MKREELLDKAKEIVVTGKPEYGSPEDSFRMIADLWSTFTGVSFEPHHVAIMMILLKIARLDRSPGHEDSWIDIAGYAACGAETLHGIGGDAS